jgi:hypothetical protein
LAAKGWLPAPFLKSREAGYQPVPFCVCYQLFADICDSEQAELWQEVFARKVQDSARRRLSVPLRPTRVKPSQSTTVASKERFACRHDAVTRASLPFDFSRGGFMRSQDLLKPDVMSEVILMGAGGLVFAILILILIVVLTQASAPL